MEGRKVLDRGCYSSDFLSWLDTCPTPDFFIKSVWPIGEEGSVSVFFSSISGLEGLSADKEPTYV